jgi:hypothetical protein
VSIAVMRICLYYSKWGGQGIMDQTPP